MEGCYCGYGCYYLPAFKKKIVVQMADVSKQNIWVILTRVWIRFWLIDNLNCYYFYSNWFLVIYYNWERSYILMEKPWKKSSWFCNFCTTTRLFQPPRLLERWEYQKPKDGSMRWTGQNTCYIKCIFFSLMHWFRKCKFWKKNWWSLFSRSLKRFFENSSNKEKTVYLLIHEK